MHTHKIKILDQAGVSDDRFYCGLILEIFLIVYLFSRIQNEPGSSPDGAILGIVDSNKVSSFELLFQEELSLFIACNCSELPISSEGPLKCK